MGIHNDLYEFEHRLDRIWRLTNTDPFRVSTALRRQYLRGRRTDEKAKEFVRKFTQQLDEFRQQRTSILREISSLESIAIKIRSKLAEIQIKIPVLRETDYKEDWKLMNAVESLRSVDGKVPMATSVHNEILGLISHFEKIEVMKKLKESIKPIQDSVEHPLLSYIKEMADAPALLRKSASRVDELGLEIKKVKLRLESTIRIRGYMKALDPEHFGYKNPEVPELDKIDSFKAKIEKNVDALNKMGNFIEQRFRTLRLNFLPFVSNDIRNELQWFKGDISEKVEKLKKELGKYIETLNSIKSINGQLKEIKQIANEQDKAINGTVIPINCSTRIMDTALLILR